MLLSKRKLKHLKIFLVSPLLEKILLIEYLILFSIIISISSFESTSALDNYTIRKNLLEYYDEGNLTNVKNFDNIYTYL